MIRVASLAFAGLMATTAIAGGNYKDIVDTAASTEGFSTLVAAVQAADLVDTLKSDGPFTVFAPTDAAFAALPEGTVENLLKPENKDQLIAVLTYHVVPGKVMSTDLQDDMQAVTVQGGSITIDLDNGVMINDASVAAADIETANGVIHVIDKVILPSSATGGSFYFGKNCGLSNQFDAREEVCDLNRCGFRCVGTVDRVFANGFRELCADGAGGCVCRVGCAHDLAQARKT